MFVRVKRFAAVVFACLGCRRAPPEQVTPAPSVAPSVAPSTAPSAAQAAPSVVASTSSATSGCPGGHDPEAWSARAIVADRSPISAKMTSESVTAARIDAELVLAADAKVALDLGGRAGDTRVSLDGVRIAEAKNGDPLFVPERALSAGRHTLRLEVTYGKHIAKVRSFGELAAGTPGLRRRGIVSRTFTSVDGSNQTLVAYFPRCVDLAVPRPVVVALPGWSNGPYTFAPSRLIEEAERLGFIVLTPETRGNVLYTGKAEAGVLEALEVLAKDVAIDRDRVHLIGVSMGGAGALQIGYHYPDRFASIVSFYGDSLYDRNTYVGKILRTQSEAERYSVLLFPENARHLPVVLIHAEDDPVSPFRESQQLYDAAVKYELNMRLIAPKTGGHTLELFESHVKEAVETFTGAKRILKPGRVTFKTSSATYSRAYWVSVTLEREGAFGAVDVSIVNGSVRVDRAEGVREIAIDLPAAGLSKLTVVGTPAVPVVARPL